MLRILITMEYLGSAFCGYQRQKNGTSVQEVVERAILLATGESVAITAGGRTDSGVHALAQTAHFDTACTIPPERIAAALNTFLPQTVKIKSSREVAASFHARYDVKKKTYLYRMYRAQTPSPTRWGLSTRVPEQLNVAAMQLAAQDLVGTHNFEAFRASGSTVKGSVRTIYAAELTECGDELHFTVTGSGFLYNMVRIIAGTLIEVGQGKRSSDGVRRALQTGNRNDAGFTAPPDGLYLYRVEY